MARNACSMIAGVALCLIASVGCHERTAMHQADAEATQSRTVNIPSDPQAKLQVAQREAAGGDYGMGLLLVGQVLKVEPDNREALSLLNDWRTQTGLPMLRWDGNKGELYPNWYDELVEESIRRFFEADMDDYAQPLRNRVQQPQPL